MKDWDPNFGPSYTPKEMLEMGVFEGKYINIIKNVDIPKHWYKIKKVLKKEDKPDESLNYYKIKSRQPLSVWKENNWIYGDDIGGWFHWYIAYYLGRRDEEIDKIQISRWKSFVARHQGQITSNCSLKDKKCRPKQRQGLLQWGWDSSVKYSEEQVHKNAKRLAKMTNSKVALEVFKDVKFSKTFDW